MEKGWWRDQKSWEKPSYLPWGREFHPPPGPFPPSPTSIFYFLFQKAKQKQKQVSQGRDLGWGAHGLCLWGQVSGQPLLEGQEDRAGRGPRTSESAPHQSGIGQATGHDFACVSVLQAEHVPPYDVVPSMRPVVLVGPSLKGYEVRGGPRLQGHLYRACLRKAQGTVGGGVLCPHKVCVWRGLHPGLCQGYCPSPKGP